MIAFARPRLVALDPLAIRIFSETATDGSLETWAMGEAQKLSGPDLAAGIGSNELADGSMLQGHAGGEAVLLARRGDEYFAIGAHCSHYSGPLVDGLMVGDSVRCPWHHACFNLRTGEPVRAPALSAVSCWKVERRDGKIFVAEKFKGRQRIAVTQPAARETVAIVGGGAAGNAAAEMLRREGHNGRILMISADEFAPYDRPNLSKDYLAGNASEAWIPLRSAEFYRKRDIELLLNTRVATIETGHRRLTLQDGSSCDYDALILATGAQPVQLGVPGATSPHVRYLRSLADCRAIIAAAERAKRVVVVGAGFIGMEVAASLRMRGLEVHVVATESRPMERVLGPEMGNHIRKLHEAHDVRFHLGQTVTAIDDQRVTLRNGGPIDTDCRLTYESGGKTLAVVTIGRDKESLEAEVAMERRIAETV